MCIGPFNLGKTNTVVFRVNLYTVIKTLKNSEGDLNIHYIQLENVLSTKYNHRNVLPNKFS